jgi:hypothetical protein
MSTPAFQELQGELFKVLFSESRIVAGTTDDLG